MFGLKTMFDGVWSPNIFRSSRPLDLFLMTFSLPSSSWFALGPGQSGYVWRPNTIKHCLVTNNLSFGHFVWGRTIVSDCVWMCLIKFEGHQAFHHKRSNISVVLVFNGRCFVRLDSRESNICMFDAGMLTTLAQRLVQHVLTV